MTFAERLAMRFHAVYEELAPRYGYKTREDTRLDWDELPPENKQLMVATADRLIQEFSLQ